MKPLTANDFTIDSKYILPYLGKYETVVFVGTNTDNNLLFRLENSLTIIVVSPNNLSVISNCHEPSQTTMNTEYTEQPFNLETALKHPEWVYFRNGEKPLEWHWFEKIKIDRPLISVDNRNLMQHHNTEGCTNLNTPYDLILRVPHYDRWICLYPSKYTLHETKEEAEKDADIFVLFILPVKIPAI